MPSPVRGVGAAGPARMARQVAAAARRPDGEWNVEVRSALAVVMLAGCWTSSPPELAPRPLAEQARSAGPPAARRSRTLPIRTSWEGHYFCTQGKTAMRLTIETNPGGEAIVLFEFGPLPDNPYVPVGSYQLIGTHAPGDDGTTVLELSPDKWIVQPPGYASVSLSAEIDGDHAEISGRPHNAQCGELHGTRVP